ncbi:hypothetical protein C8J56DRAFT_891485 [Mycena floridula]|nr:hypothetical protein C8J56DRAFT_891485 [Mycena floridula]
MVVPSMISRPVTPPLVNKNQGLAKRAASCSPEKQRRETKRAQVSAANLPIFTAPDVKPNVTELQATTTKPKVGGKEAPKKGRKKPGQDTVVITISDDEVLSDNSPKRQWTDEQRSALFVKVLGADSDDQFERLQKNSTRVFNKGVFERAFTMYTAIKSYESFTGGAGDGNLNADTDDPDATFNTRLDAARLAGRFVGPLTARAYKIWMDKGCFCKSGKVARTYALSSNGYASEDDFAQSDSSLPATLTVKSDKLKSTVKSDKLKSVCKASAAATVSEPKHTPAKGFKQESSMSGLQDLMALKSQSERLKLEMLKEQRKINADAQKIELAKSIMNMPNADPELLEQAKRTLMKHLMSE